MKKTIKLRLFTGITTLFCILFTYMNFNMPQEVKDCFNVSDSFWIGWGYFFIVCSIIWGIGFISSFEEKTTEVKNG